MVFVISVFGISARGLFLIALVNINPTPGAANPGRDW